MFEAATSLVKEPLPVVYNPQIPIETFDFIIIDECHRSIYNVWRQVLEYFDAFLIGLTATPTAQTVGFFNGNLVQDYSHEKAVVDGVNVGYDVYRIETKVTKDGATLAKEPGQFIPHRDRRTRKKKLKELDDDLTYTANDLDRDVVTMDQIRLVVRTFKERLFTEIFPGRTEVPKTLVFAKTDLHADDIVKVIREEFGRGNDFCQKITSKTTGKKPDDLLNEFRNSYNPRIAVTVDMIATGTDVKPLECLLFMRNINSASYFEQMKGRGCRVIKSDDLQSVTPDAKQKTHFVIVDAVGVCERTRRPRSHWIASRPYRWKRFSTWWQPVRPATTSARPWRHGSPGSTGRLATFNERRSPSRPMAKTFRPSAANCWRPSIPDVNTQRAIQQFSLAPRPGADRRAA